MFGGAVRLERGAKATDYHLATMINNSFSGNTASFGGAICSSNAKPLIINSVFWGNHAPNGCEIYLYTIDSAEIAFSIINPDFVRGYIDNGGGNLNTDPMFEDTVYLIPSSTSSCINAGTLAFTCDCGDTHNCPAYDILGASRPQGTKADMGAYESNKVGIEDFGLRVAGCGLWIYPNPFTYSTTITYTLEESSLVNLRVFDSYGKLVAELVNSSQQKGEQKFEWNPTTFSAGIYLCHLQAGNKVVTTKIVKMH